MNITEAIGKEIGLGVSEFLSRSCSNNRKRKRNNKE